MRDTAFSVAPQNQSRFAALYAPLSGGDMNDSEHNEMAQVAIFGGENNTAFLKPTDRKLFDNQFPLEMQGQSPGSKSSHTRFAPC